MLTKHEALFSTKPLLFLVYLFLPTLLTAQTITFDIEELSAPKNRLPTQQSSEIFKELTMEEANITHRDIHGDSIQFNSGIIVHSHAKEIMVNYGFHSFFNGMYQAYADHRPFVLSPDMIWLLISQGFARHVNANAEELRTNFVTFDGKVSLVVKTDIDLIGTSAQTQDWEKIFPQFTEQISLHTGEELISTLSADFSTTTPTTKVASEITIMEAVEPYFEYIVIMIGCGIPTITLKGTTEDWQKVYDKTEQLTQYDLAWWTKELEPILKEFIRASEGKVDKTFWKAMFKYHERKTYGSPKTIDGWIVKFYPYDKDGNRNDLKQIQNRDDLPEEIVKVNLTHIDITQDPIKKTPLELWAGFVGLRQNYFNYTLTPQIGWLVKTKKGENDALNQRLRKKASEESMWGGIDIRVTELPEILYELDSINNLSVQFVDSINIEDRLAKVKIKRMNLRGKIDTKGYERLKELFPNTQLYVNGQ